MDIQATIPAKQKGNYTYSIYIYATDSEGKEILVWAFMIPAIAGMVAGGLLDNNTLIITSALIILIPLTLLVIPLALNNYRQTNKK